MNTTLVVAGAVFMAGAIAGGGLEGLGIKVPVLNKTWQHWSLGTLGALMFVAGMVPLFAPLVKRDSASAPGVTAPSGGNPNTPVSPGASPHGGQGSAGVASKNVPLISLPVVGNDQNGYTVTSAAVSGKTYNNVLSSSDDCSTYGSITYQVSRKYKTLHALVGVTGEPGSSDSINFSVSIDDSEDPSQAGPSMNAGETPQPIDVNISNATTITLWAVAPNCVTPGNGIWINPVLSK